MQFRHITPGARRFGPHPQVGLPNISTGLALNVEAMCFMNLLLCTYPRGILP